MPKIVSIIIVKNEADILTEHLTESAQYFDSVAYLDNGSSDQSYEIAKNHSLVHWIGKTNAPFQVSMRGEVMLELYKNKIIKRGDWLFLIAPDHLFESNLIDDVKKAEDEGANCISYKFPCFCYTDLDYLNESKRERHQLIRKTLLFYTMYPNPNNKTIITAMKYDHKIFYEFPNQEPPIIKDKKIASFTGIQRHYRFRSQSQIKKRLKDRCYAIKRGTKSFKHYESQWNWEKWIIDHKLLHNVADYGWVETNHLGLSELRSRSAAIQSELFCI